MTSLATIATSGANPGSFYGRAGRGPAAAITAAEAAAAALADALREAGPGAQPAACAAITSRIHHTARSLAWCLRAEADLAAAALTPDMSVPEPPAAGEARDRAARAAQAAGAAAGHARAGWRALDADLRSRPAVRPDRGDSRALRLMTEADARAAELAAHLDIMSSRTIPASLPMIEGHAQVIRAISLRLTRLGRTCDQLADAIADSAGQGGPARPARVTGPLRHAAGDLASAASTTGHVHDVLASAAGIIRNAPAGIPCAGCTGTGTSRLGGGPCGRCRGGGTDPYAGRR